MITLAHQLQSAEQSVGLEHPHVAANSRVLLANGNKVKSLHAFTSRSPQQGEKLAHARANSHAAVRPSAVRPYSSVFDRAEGKGCTRARYQAGRSSQTQQNYAPNVTGLPALSRKLKSGPNEKLVAMGASAPSARAGAKVAVCVHFRAVSALQHRCLRPYGRAGRARGPSRLQSASAHAQARLWLRAGQRRARHARPASLPRAQEHSAYRSVHRAIARAVQGFLA